MSGTWRRDTLETARSRSQAAKRLHPFGDRSGVGSGSNVRHLVEGHAGNSALPKPSGQAPSAPRGQDARSGQAAMPGTWRRDTLATARSRSQAAKHLQPLGDRMLGRVKSQDLMLSEGMSQQWPTPDAGPPPVTNPVGEGRAVGVRRIPIFLSIWILSGRGDGLPGLLQVCRRVGSSLSVISSAAHPNPC